MSNLTYETLEVVEICSENDTVTMTSVKKPVIAEISLRIIVNGDELASILCLNQHQEHLAVGFLFSEGVIHTYGDIQSIHYHEPTLAVIIQLIPGITAARQTGLRSITSGCGKCYTTIHPLSQDNYQVVHSPNTTSANTLLTLMKKFMKQSDIFSQVGGVHSLLFHAGDYEILSEDIGRHNCFDKIAGILLKEGQMDLAPNAVLFVSGRVSSEIISKVIRMGVGILVSRSTPTASAVRLAQEYNVTLLGYVRQNHGYIYAHPERLTL